MGVSGVRQVYIVGEIGMVDDGSEEVNEGCVEVVAVVLTERRREGTDTRAD